VAGNNFDNITWSVKSSENNPAGPNVVSTTTVSIPYSYTLDGASCVPAIVSQTAGANTGLKVSDGSCTPTTPTATPTSTSTPTSTPTTTPTSTPTPTPTSTTPSGTNLSLAAGADGSSKGSGTSYGNVKDGSLSTYWSPSGSTGSISIKWGSATRVAKVNLRETSGASGRIGAWKLINADTGAVLKTGTGAGVISFTATSLKKITFEITSASSTPQVAEFETYAS